MAGRLNDQEVASEMNKMVAFIKQEALEKAREIKVKADEEFNIEKAKIVRQETVAIEAFYEKKKKQAETQRKIAISNHINKNRLRVLQARQQILTELTQAGASQLVQINQDKEKYHALLKDLILQIFYQLMEKNVRLQSRQADADAVKAAAEAAKEVYLKEVGGTLEYTLDDETWLSEKGAGGVVGSSVDGRIKVNNSLEKRLELVSEQMLPDIRILLFGPSPNRRFYN
ncbi:V-ATPase V1 sector subunit E [Rhizophlyctis rosea]|uniref:V-ATPase V1 sector subunit E n=1 Tax=Rhizophlyctis rosea TaxID=64517 RepID=A0AAD5X5A6_9FUNG|nr:V-ATPase V1 sector subunit E [Rhizophlyctis rosea]